MKTLGELHNLFKDFALTTSNIELRICGTVKTVELDNRLADKARYLALEKIRREIDMLESKYGQELERDADLLVR